MRLLQYALSFLGLGQAIAMGALTLVAGSSIQFYAMYQDAQFETQVNVIIQDSTIATFSELCDLTHVFILNKELGSRDLMKVEVSSLYQNWVDREYGLLKKRHASYCGLERPAGVTQRNVQYSGTNEEGRSWQVKVACKA